ncbi:MULTISPECIES: hypothetical protein [Tepidibacillus]|uniref:Uncharacterized protein n=1 Tax=Tepidibacillus decaturensis TaxID=1413211 RepID=A0A135L2R3_9BACI|nr:MULTISPECIES: hypothetical protein [Tepidibacillus]KXG43271.1 hypothetical protein U473_04025 [Tepidibacillus decaturensis]GBF11017.1 hypothetical protein HK1_01035 [Tepidibacillus sp. HK-1]
MELFIKRFIDLLDEMIPVSMVHTLIEQPLGAVIHDSYVRIHARIDLADEDSPYVEIELYPYHPNQMDCLYAFTFPQKGILVNENDFVNKLKEQEELKIQKVTSIEENEDYFYEVFYEEQMKIPENNAKKDELIDQMISKIKDWLYISGFHSTEEE